MSMMCDYAFISFPIDILQWLLNCSHYFDNLLSLLNTHTTCACSISIEAPKNDALSYLLRVDFTTPLLGTRQRPFTAEKLAYI